MPDARPASSRLGDRKLRSSLLAYVARCGVPSREREDVVQLALTNAWKQRDSLPATPYELERWLYTISHHRSVDEHRRQARRPLARPKLAPDPSSDDGCSLPDDEPEAEGEVRAMVTPVDRLELRDGLRLAEAEVAKHPSWRQAFSWTLRSFGGESYADIASADGVTEEAVRSSIRSFRRRLREALPDVAKMFFYVALAMIVYGVYRQHHVEPAVPTPKPEHSIVAPAPAPSPAVELRRRALEECDAQAWHECLLDLDRAREIDPAGDDDPRVRDARAAAERALEPGDKPK